jgi:hypothetical protein
MRRKRIGINCQLKRNYILLLIYECQRNLPISHPAEDSLGEGV